MGYKKLSNEQEKQLVQEYVSGVPVKDLMVKYNFATKKSITDKVKKHYGENYKELIDLAKANRKGYHYTFEKINSQFDAYYLGLLLTDGYISVRNEHSYEFVKSLINEEIKVVADPTLLFDFKTDTKNKNVDEEYILTYVLNYFYALILLI